jgi:hypothetical protein
MMMGTLPFLTLILLRHEKRLTHFAQRQRHWVGKSAPLEYLASECPQWAQLVWHYVEDVIKNFYAREEQQHKCC